MPGERHRFTTREDRLAHEIARSERRAHPRMPYSKALSVGYATVNKRKQEVVA